MGYLLTGNCNHIANAPLQKKWFEFGGVEDLQTDGSEVGGFAVAAREAVGEAIDSGVAVEGGVACRAGRALATLAPPLSGIGKIRMK